MIEEFYSGNAEYFKRVEYFSIVHVIIDNVKYAVVRGIDNINSLDEWLREDEKMILESDPLLDGFVVKDY